METNLPAPQTRHRLSIASVISMISGILTHALVIFHSLIDMSLILAIFLAPIAAILAIITGHKATREIKRSDGVLTGRKMAKTGLILGYLYLIICIVLIILAILLFGGIVAGLTSLLGNLGFK
jgi:hypothetical protein